MVAVSIIIPVFNKLAFTRQCLERIARYASEEYPHEVIVVDNASTDGTRAFLRDLTSRDSSVRLVEHDSNLGYSRGNNAGATCSRGTYLLFLNNDTIVQPGWLEAMVKVAEADSAIGIVGIKQLFPYTNTIHHTGIIFTADRRPQHIYPHADASSSFVNKQREYQAVTGACLLIPRELFSTCGMFDEGYVNGYEDVDLCLKVRQRGRKIVCCTDAFIYHYGQITETRTADDDKNAARFAERWGPTLEPDEHIYFRKDQRDINAARGAAAPISAAPKADDDLIYFGDDLASPSALTWVTSELVLALRDVGSRVAIRRCTLPASTDPAKRKALESLMYDSAPNGGTQIRWSHYWPQHLGLDLAGTLNLELFVINYLFAQPGTAPWDYWLQTLPQNRYLKLPLSTFCRDVLVQTGVAADRCHILRPGYSPEVHQVAAPSRRSTAFRFLTVTNSHDLERYGTSPLLDAYWQAFSARDDVVLVVKDYGASSGNRTLRDRLKAKKDAARVEYVGEFTSKEKLIELYKSCDAFVSAHRGEGYGMKLLDALACGLPVVTPLFGGPADFCSPENCFPVDFSLAPVGDCLDTRSLQITNGPVWAEPDVGSLVRELRRVAESPDLAKRIAAQGQRDVVERLTWSNAAKCFATYLQSIERPTRAVSTPAPVRAPREQSPYWMGLRVSIVIPTYNRKASLLKCLRALQQQTILPQEFEVIVVDDGSTDGTRELLASMQFPFDVKYLSQSNQGPGTARNEGIKRAEGELVLFLGDDIIADERLLEEHLIAHATRDRASAILGHIDWDKDLAPSPVMDFVCGDSSLQFAYKFIPNLAALDYRFFYTSNISLKREFLLEAAAAGIGFDPDFRFAAFEDSEFAYRLERRGLRTYYAAGALAYHDHKMDLDSFARREHRVGQMAVVFYRKHPQLDEQLKVRWIGDWTRAVEQVTMRPDFKAKVRALDSDTDQFFRSLEHSLQSLLALQAVETDHHLSTSNRAAVTKSLNGILGVIFDVERTRGKVEEWYSGVADRERVENAKLLIGTVRKLEFFAAQATEVEELRGTIAWLSHDVVTNLQSRVADLERQLGVGARSRLALDRMAWRLARKADFAVQQRLSGRGDWLNRYRNLRTTMKRLLRRDSGRPRISA